MPCICIYTAIKNNQKSLNIEKKTRLIRREKNWTSSSSLLDVCFCSSMSSNPNATPNIQVIPTLQITTVSMFLILFWHFIYWTWDILWTISWDPTFKIINKTKKDHLAQYWFSIRLLFENESIKIFRYSKTFVHSIPKNDSAL